MFEGIIIGNCILSWLCGFSLLVLFSIQIWSSLNSSACGVGNGGWNDCAKVCRSGETPRWKWSLDSLAALSRKQGILGAFNVLWLRLLGGLACGKTFMETQASEVVWPPNRSEAPFEALFLRPQAHAAQSPALLLCSLHSFGVMRLFSAIKAPLGCFY